jgi:hypothetical protein
MEKNKTFININILSTSAAAAHDSMAKRKFYKFFSTMLILYKESERETFKV